MPTKKLTKKNRQAIRNERFERFHAFARENATLNTDLSEEEIAALIERAREEVYQARQQEGCCRNALQHLLKRK